MTCLPFGSALVVSHKFACTLMFCITSSKLNSLLLYGNRFSLKTRLQNPDLWSFHPAARKSRNWGLWGSSWRPWGLNTLKFSVYNALPLQFYEDNRVQYKNWLTITLGHVTTIISFSFLWRMTRLIVCLLGTQFPMARPSTCN